VAHVTFDLRADARGPIAVGKFLLAMVGRPAIDAYWFFRPCPGFGWVHVNFLVSLSKTKNVSLRTVVGLAVTDCDVSWHSSRTDYIPRINARIVAVGIPGASAISQVGTFLIDVSQGACAAPIPKLFPSYIQCGAMPATG
jgi:hypothetical protein